MPKHTVRQSRKPLAANEAELLALNPTFAAIIENMQRNYIAAHKPQRDMRTSLQRHMPGDVFCRDCGGCISYGCDCLEPN